MKSGPSRKLRSPYSINPRFKTGARLSTHTAQNHWERKPQQSAVSETEGGQKAHSTGLTKGKNISNFHNCSEAEYPTNSVTSLHNPGTLGIDKASSVKEFTLLASAACCRTQGYTRNKKTFQDHLFALSREE